MTSHSTTQLGVFRQDAPGARGIFISARGVRVGRDPVSEIALHDPQVSRRHTFLWAQGGRSFARDEGSANGTFVNGQRLAGTVELHAGDVLHVGQTTFVLLSMPAPAVNLPAPLIVIGAALLLVAALMIINARTTGDQARLSVLGSPTATPTATATTAATATPSPSPAGALNTATPPATATRVATPLPPATPTPNASQRLRDPVQATVQLRIKTGSATISGSGSIVNARGLILTNFHVVGDPDTGKFHNAQRLVDVAITKWPNGEAEWRYQATPVEWDTALDLAVLRITADLGGRPLSGNLSLPTVPLGDSDALNFGDHLEALGYPGIGGESLTVTEGTVAGFDPPTGRREWIKSNVEVNRGNSGGMAIDDKGRLVAVPSEVLTDSPGGRTIGKLSYLRPINLAKPLISKAEAKLP
jgi:S1-C subfamily serine protease